MKKKVFVFTFIISLILIGGVVFIIVLRTNYQNDKIIKTFTTNDYQYYIDNYSTERYLGKIKDYKDAKEKAELMWLELYGLNIKNKKPFVVYYDSSYGIWLVSGSMPKNTVGGVPYILLREADGKVKAVWHDK